MAQWSQWSRYEQFLQILSSLNSQLYVIPVGRLKKPPLWAYANIIKHVWYTYGGVKKGKKA
jgi:hypothetical protein